MKKGLMLSAIALVALAVALPAVAEDAPDGKALYASKCAMCHGADGVAKKMAEGSGNFNDPEWQKKTTAETIEKDIHGGKGKMPKFEGKLTAEQIKAIAAYVKTLK
jgi:mono/diheme cytochrome c family protein